MDIGAIQAVAMDFDGVFTDNRVLLSEEGVESVFVSRSDGMGISALRSSGYPLIVISSEENPIVSVRCKKLGIPCRQGTLNKLEVLRQWSEKIEIEMGNIAFIGNDINDIECLKACGAGVAVADAHPAILDSVQWVLSSTGGKGAIREFADLLLRGPHENHVQ